MPVSPKIRELFADRKQGYSLPQALYLDPEMHEFDLQAIFYRNWLQVGLEAELPRPGDYLTLNVGRSSVIVLRNAEGAIGAFFNTCRHRGAQICRESRGHMGRLVCPYHQWSYDLSGRLAHTPFMHKIDNDRFGLLPVRVETVAGVIFICLADRPPDFTPLREKLAPMLEPHNLRDARVAHTATWVERADWKLTMQNARECYHCRAGHPQLLLSYSDFTGSDNSRDRDARIAALNARCEARGLKTGWTIGPWYELGRFPLLEGAVSYTTDGKPAVAQKLGAVGDGDVGVMWWGLQPNSFNHVVCDYGFFFQAFPTGPQETTVTGKWIVHKDAVEGVDYEQARLLEVWTATNEQDRALVENNHRGISSIAYAPGPYSQITEQMAMRFDEWYCAAAQDFIYAAEKVD